MVRASESTSGVVSPSKSLRKSSRRSGGVASRARTNRSIERVPRIAASSYAANTAGPYSRMSTSWRVISGSDFRDRGPSGYERSERVKRPENDCARIAPALTASST
jgi:hypothetical protein